MMKFHDKNIKKVHLKNNISTKFLKNRKGLKKTAKVFDVPSLRIFSNLCGFLKSIWKYLFAL